MGATFLTEYELIFVLVNQGFTDVVMNAAREQGAHGGTILTTRGSANEKAENNYGIAITPNKELVLILVEAETKENVMQAIYKVAGIETNGMAIIFSTHANNVVGIKEEAPSKETK